MTSLLRVSEVGPLRASPVGARFPHLPRVLRVRGRGAVTAARGPDRRQRGADIIIITVIVSWCGGVASAVATLSLTCFLTAHVGDHTGSLGPRLW